MYTMKNYSALKKNKILSFVTEWMDLEAIMLTEISQSDTGNTTRFYIYAEPKEPCKHTKQKQTHRYKEQTE